MAAGFVYLRDVDPTIRQDMRYAGSLNFTGRRVPGYEAPECVLVREAAEALKAAQAELKGRGFSLEVYDCYRPERAVKAFVGWAGEPDDPDAKASYYPRLRKSELFPDYIATVSGHSRGATVDLTIVPADRKAETEPMTAKAQPRDCTASRRDRNGSAALDMGTTFDCFDRKANTSTSGLTPKQDHNRKLLLGVMERHGFKNYEKEWWHFTLRNEPFPDRIFDFPILPRPEPAPGANDSPRP
jgi:D-alanyl-D-alanine dipeptidase